MTALPKTRLTADEFIAWAMDQESGRYELADGEIVAMSPESVGHARAKLAAATALASAIRLANLPCEALVDGVAVRIDDRTVYEPDALVRCGPPVPDEAVRITDPVIVVEVVSPSSTTLDSGAKLEGYFRLPSVRHYLVINHRARAVTHHRRDDRGLITTSIVRDGELSLEPPGLTVAFAALLPPA
jgi:Uma2 family endonuclease